MHQKQTERSHIAPWEKVTVTDMGHIVEIQHMEKRNTECHIRKIDSDHYVNLKTGELLEFAKSENRSQNENSLRQTFKKLRYLINNNFDGSPNELHVTLTYKENMTDLDRLYKDFKRFIMRLKRSFKDVSTIDYLSVIEPQQRGAWHAHMLIRFNDIEQAYLPNKVDRKTGKSIDAPLRDMWEQGNVTIRSLKDVDNIGAYLSAYLTDVEVPDGVETTHKDVVVKNVEGKEKRFIKGGRLWMYPPGMNLFRKSKGIVYPNRKEMAYKDIKKVVGSAKPHYSKQYLVEQEEFKNTITYEQYNLKRT